MDNEKEAILKAVTDTLAGDTEAYTVIVKAYMNKLYGLARSICSNDAVAEDLTQETLIEGYLRLSSLREPEKIEAWLVRILKNKTFNYVTRARYTEDIDGRENLFGSSSSPERIYLAKESYKALRRRLLSLPPALKECAELYFIYKMPLSTIADRLCLPLGTVKRRIHDAREKLRKEEYMSKEKNTVSDNFAEELSRKIKELEAYLGAHKPSGSFENAYGVVKELIANLSNRDDVRTYAVKGASIAVQMDMDKYADESLEVYRKYNEVKKASDLLLDICWESNDYKYKLNYTKETILPALEAYPESEDRSLELGYHYFWLARYVDKTTSEGIDEAEGYLNTAIKHYGNTKKANSSYANTIAALKGIEALRDDNTKRYILVTGERWKIEDGNVYYCNQPGCNYACDGNLDKFHNYIFHNAGAEGDRYFLPRTIPLEAGACEDMLDRDGSKKGIRRIVSVSETVETVAGVFYDCLHVEKITNNDRIDAWYKKGVGLVKISENDALRTKVLSAYEIHGGQGYMPCAVGNRWCYENPLRPDVMVEKNEYVIEREESNEEFGDFVCVSCFNYIALKKDWEKISEEPVILFSYVATLCSEKKYIEARDTLRNIVMLNKSRESVDIAMSVLEYLEEKLPYDAEKWRFCPSSANLSSVEVTSDSIRYGEGNLEYFDMGPWGTRREENRIYGVKPFRYLQQLCHTLWSDKWVAGYTEEHRHSWKRGTVKLSVDDGGELETPAGIFKDTVHLVVDFDLDKSNGKYEHYFHRNVDCGRKEFWFARGVGVIRFKCDWNGTFDSDCYLTKYNVIAKEGEMMPIHIGNFWRYEEKNLTEENYIARRDYKVIGGMNGNYTLSDMQMFTWRGSVEEYEAWKKTLIKE